MAYVDTNTMIENIICLPKIRKKNQRIDSEFNHIYLIVKNDFIKENEHSLIVLINS